MLVAVAPLAAFSATSLPSLDEQDWAIAKMINPMMHTAMRTGRKLGLFSAGTLFVGTGAP
jgi:hypothetical protein